MTISPSPLKSPIKPSFLSGFSFSPLAQPISKANCWSIADVPTDVVVEVSGVSFALHKIPLVSRCGLLRMLVAEDREGEISRVELEGMPGGTEGFELAVKFCYGVGIEISKYNAALLRCVAEFLDMSEEHGEDNLISQTEAYLERLAQQSFKEIVTVLHSCEDLLPLAEDLQIVDRCIEWAAVKAVQDEEDNKSSLISFQDFQHYLSNSIDWWVEDLSVLHIDFYQRVLAALRGRGLKTEGIGGALVYYAHKSLRGLAKKNVGSRDPLTRNKLKVHDASTAMEHEQRVLVETIVSLLPREKHVASISFLIGLLRTACILETTLACRLDLEKRIGAQMHRATLDDLLIPSLGNCNGETLFDVDAVHQLVASFIEQHGEDGFDEDFSEVYEDNDSYNSPMQNPMVKVGKLVDAYLAEVAADANLSLSKFMALAELLPNYARPLDDGLYRAIDIFLKAHMGLTDVERKKLCGLLDFQKLSQDACTHAAQNERLPLQAVVQVLYFEQMRIRNLMSGTYNDTELLTAAAAVTATSMYKMSNGLLNGGQSPKDHYASVRRENRELKLEVARMRMRLSDLEKDHINMKHEMEKGHLPHQQHHHHHHHHGFLHAVSKSLNKLNPFHHHKLNPFHHSHSHSHSHSQPYPQSQSQSHSQQHTQRRASSISSSSSQASFEQSKKEARLKRISLS